MAMPRQDRMGRKEFALFLLASVALALIAQLVWADLHFFVSFTAMISFVSEGRVHDLGRKRWWLLFQFVALVVAAYHWKSGEGLATVEVAAYIVLAISLSCLLLLPGQPGANRYGPPSLLPRQGRA